MRLHTARAAFTAVLLLLAAACTTSEEVPAATTASAPRTPGATPAGLTRPLSLPPLGAPIHEETAAPGLTFIDLSLSTSVTISSPNPVPEPIGFRDALLLTRLGDEYPLFDPVAGEVARARSYGPTPGPPGLAPGATTEDMDRSPTLAYRVEFVGEAAAYDVVLVETASGERTNVTEAEVGGSAEPFVQWSATGQFFLHVTARRAVVFDVEDRSVRQLPDDWGVTLLDGSAAWSAAADVLLLVRSDSISLLDASTWERTVLSSDPAARAHFSADGSHIAIVTGHSIDVRTTVLDSESLQPLLSLDGFALSITGPRLDPAVALIGDASCAGVLVEARSRSICFEQAVDAAIAPGGTLVALAYREGEPTALDSPVRWRVETYNLVTDDRATVHLGPLAPLDQAGPSPFMLWSDDDRFLVLYWFWLPPSFTPGV